MIGYTAFHSHTQRQNGTGTKPEPIDIANTGLQNWYVGEIPGNRIITVIIHSQTSTGIAMPTHIDQTNTLVDKPIAVGIQTILDIPVEISIEQEAKSWLEASESAFAFWDNDEDAAYDKL